MRDPLVFVCMHVQDPPPGTASKCFYTLESPSGPVIMAIASQELADIMALLYGIAAHVFLLPETQLSPEIVGSLTQHRVVIIRTPADYNGATGNKAGFPWPDRVVLFDFAGALARNTTA